MEEGDEQPIRIYEETAMCFTDGADYSNMSGEVTRALKLKDFAEQRGNLTLRQPICFECFVEIIKLL